MSQVLVVDDDKATRKLLALTVQKSGHACSQAENAIEARSQLDKDHYDLMLCDIRMPGENGWDFSKKVLSDYPDTAVILVTGVDDPQLAATALDSGAYGYVVKPFKVTEMVININNVLRRKKLEKELNNYQDHLEKYAQERTIQLEQTLSKLRKAMTGIIDAFSVAVELRDPYTAGHQKRVSDLARAIATEMNCSGDLIDSIHMAGIVHDVGKISVPTDILNKPGKLNELEFGIIKMHPQTGYDILKGIDFPWPVAKIVLQHHERLNGSGYPLGISLDEILPEAKILAVADVVEAIMSHRPYRPALGPETAMAEISKNSGILYDDDVVAACLNLFKNKEFKFTQ
jgi:response regulator RpfG family c-di-GMP phosphodiesterase